MPLRARAPSRFGRRAGATACLLGALVCASPARGQGGADKAAAQVLFDEGKALLTDGRYAEACPKLEESLRLDRGIGTLLYLAECFERTGRTASAWVHFTEAAELAKQEQDAREKIASDRAERLAPLLSTLAIEVPAASEVPGLAVMRDGTEIGRPLWGRATPVDPGEHVLRAAAPGRVVWESKVTVRASSDRVVVRVPPLVAAAPPPAPPPRIEQPPKIIDRPPPPSSGATQRILGLGVGGLGLVSVGVGAVFGLSAISKNDRADAACPAGACTPEGVSLGEDALRQANVSTVFFVVGGVLVAGGAALFLTAPRGAVAAGVRPSPSGFAVRF